MPIPPLPEGLSYDPGGNCAVFLATVINPTFGRWITVDEYTDVDELHAYGVELCRANPESGGEYHIADSEGYDGLIGEGPLELAVNVAAVLDKLDDKERDAFPVWVGHLGAHWTLWTTREDTRAPTDPEALEDAFRQDYVGTYDTVKDFGKEKLEEILDAENVSDTLRAIIGNFLSGESYANGDLIGDYHWSRTPHGIAVFWRK